MVLQGADRTRHQVRQLQRGSFRAGASTGGRFRGVEPLRGRSC